jgi:hypothetical protein
MEKLYADGANAKASKNIVASARSRVIAAQARLDFLQNRLDQRAHGRPC